MGDEENNKPAQSQKIGPGAILTVGGIILVYAVVRGELNIPGITAEPLKLTEALRYVAVALGAIITLYGVLAIWTALPPLPFGRERTFAFLGIIVTLLLMIVAWWLVFSVWANRIVVVGSDRIETNQRPVLIVVAALTAVLVVASLLLVWPVLPQLLPQRYRALLVAVGVGVSFLLIWGPVQWMTPSTRWVVETFPSTPGGWFGQGWTTDRDRVQGLPQPGADADSGFMSFRPQGLQAPASAERSLTDGTSGVSLEPYCSLEFQLRLDLDAANPLPAGVQRASVYLKQNGQEKAVALRQYVALPNSTDWQPNPVVIPRRAFEQAGLNVTLPVSALGFRFAMPIGNAVDIDDIAFGMCSANQ